MKKQHIFLFAFLFFSLTLLGQKAKLTGFVYDKETGEPVIYTNVYFKGTSIGATTDLNGYYAITNIPPGNYTLTIKHLNYDSLSKKIKLTQGQILNRNLFLTSKNIQLEEVRISSRALTLKKESNVSVIEVDPKNINSIPSIGGQPDMAQYMKILPGVTSTGDQGGQLYIRGGAPVENKIIMDGMIIYNPFHSIGLFSVFDTDIIQATKIYTGGFNAEYGGRISSVTDVKTRSGNKKRVSGNLNIGSLSSKLLIEGPFTKKKKTYTNPTFIFSLKEGYADRSCDIFYPYINEKEGLPFNFRDIYSKVSLNGNSGNKVDFFGYSFNDEVNYQRAHFDWDSYGFGTNLIYVPFNSATLVSIHLAFSNYEITQHNEIRNPSTSLINGFNTGFNFTNFIKKNEVKYGIELITKKTDFRYSSSVNTNIQQLNNASEIGAFVKGKILTGRLILEPGFRIHYYASLPLKSFSPEPRLSTKFLVSETIRLKLAAGLYTQDLMSSTSNVEAVNYFNGFLSGSDNMPGSYNGERLDNYQQRAGHLIIGSEIDITKNTILNIEAYYKQYFQLSNPNMEKQYPNTEAFTDKPEYLRTDFIVEEGYAKGLETSIKYYGKQFNTWLIYSLGVTERKNERFTYIPSFDRRHNINLLNSLYFGKNNTWEFNTRWNFGSGLPFTKIIGLYPVANYEDAITSDPNSFFVNNKAVKFDDYNEGRLPYYHRLDLSVMRKIRLSRNSRLQINAGITNAYDRKNIFYFSFRNGEQINQLPFMVNFGLNYYF